MSEPKPKAKLPPHVYFYTSAPDNPKVAALSNAEFRAWVYAGLSARMMVPAGQWPSRAHLSRALGDLAEHIDALVRRDLIRVYPVKPYKGVHFWTGWSKYQPGITSETQIDLERSYDERTASQREQAASRKRRERSGDVAERHGGVTAMSRPFEHGIDRPTLLSSPPLSAAPLSAALLSADSSVESLGTVAYAARAALAPSLTRQDEWTPVPCIRCKAIIVDRDDAYEGDMPDYVHLNECPV